jgi:hypothetical protein
LIDYLITRRWAVHVDPSGPVTVREAVFYLTSYREQLEARHGSTSLRGAIDASYRPSRQEIELRVQSDRRREPAGSNGAGYAGIAL